MAQYLCQFCNKILTYGENHPCFFYKNDDRVYSLPQPEESEEEDKKHDDGKDKITEITKDISRDLRREFPQRSREKSKVSFAFDSEKLGKLRTFSEKKSKIAENRNMYDASFSDIPKNDQANKDGSKENASIKPSSRNANSSCIQECPFQGNSVETEYVFEQKRSGAKVFHAIPEISKEECGTSLEDSKWQSLRNDKDIFMGFLDRSKKETYSGNKNISGISNLIARSDFPSLNEAPDNPKIEVLVSNCTSKKISTNVCESIYSTKNDNANKPGSSGTCASKNDISSNFSNYRFNEKSNLYNKDELTAAVVNEPAYSKKDQKAVTGPSGILPHKTKIGGDMGPKMFTSKIRLNNFYNTHTGDKPFECSICKKRYSLKCNLNAHYRTHTGDKAFECGICKKRFSFKCSLKAHYRIHTGEKPFACHQCGKKFTQRVQLDRHYWTHRNDYPFVCDVCNKGFSLKNPLTKHRRTHTGEKPFKCPVCGKAFAHKSNSDKHNKEKHK